MFYICFIVLEVLQKSDIIIIIIFNLLTFRAGICGLPTISVRTRYPPHTHPHPIIILPSYEDNVRRSQHGVTFPTSGGDCA